MTASGLSEEEVVVAAAVAPRPVLRSWVVSCRVAASSARWQAAIVEPPTTAIATTIIHPVFIEQALTL